MNKTIHHSDPLAHQKDSEEGADRVLKAVVIGAGFAGICMAVKLRQAGIEDFVILEKADELGGTWRENIYPGAECDIPSALYSFSFEPNHEWKYKWSGQQQILDYQRHTAGKYRLAEQLRYNHELESAEYQANDKCWHLRCSNGQHFSAQHLITAVGQLHHPSTPVISGAQQFTGASFHSARWDHLVDLSGKRVAVIGNAASAVQFIPKIAEPLEKLVIYQRSANWIVPKVDRPYTKIEQWLSKRFPPIRLSYRFAIWLLGEGMMLPAIRGNWLARKAVEFSSRRLLKQSIADPVLREKLTPKYPAGAKRILFADDFYATLQRDNVRLETSAIDKFSADGIVTEAGIEEQFDVVIYATGFKTNPFLAPIDIKGVSGKPISEAWHSGAHAYLGVSTSGFPNMHMLYGPNTNLGHTSIIIMLEAQAKYIVQCIVGLDAKSLSSLDVKAGVESSYNEALQQRLQSMAFSKVEHSWYMDAGKITNNWAGSSQEYRRKLRKVDWDAYLTD